MSRGLGVAAALALVACSARPAPRAPAASASPPVAAVASADDRGHDDADGAGVVDGAVAGGATALLDPPAVDAPGAVEDHGADEAHDAVAVDGPDRVDGDAVEPGATPADDGLGRAGPVRGYDAPGYVAFTFDDGPHPVWTARVLATLAAHDVHGTFFVVGRSLWGLDHGARRRELAATAAAGHDIGNHTWSHKRLTEVGPIERAWQIDQTSAVIRWITGRAPTTVRPPYGESDPGVRVFLRGRGLTEIGWNIDPRDWEAPTPKALRRHTVAEIVRLGGGIVILHDDKWITTQALPGILDDLEAWNCRQLAAGGKPILPVSLHYFIPRAVPAWVEARTRAYAEGLEQRCAARAERAAPNPVVDNHTAAH